MQEIRIDLDGTYMNVICFGHGNRSLLILSGISLTGLEGMGAQIADAYACFSEEFTCYLFDRKKVLPDGYDMDALAEDIVRCLFVLGVREADVFGVSQGGMIGMCLAAEHPHLVRSLILGSASAKTEPPHDAILRKWRSLAADRQVRELNRSFSELVYTPAYYTAYREIFDSMQDNGTDADCARFAVLCDSILHFDFTKRLCDIHCPVFVIGAGDDRVLGREASVFLAEKLGAALYIYENYGHAVYDEAPDYKEKLLSFLHR